MTRNRKLSVLFVCLGNICRSPTAEGAFRQQVQSHGLGEHILVDSAGTGSWHLGKAPDTRARSVAKAQGYSIDDLRARQVSAADFVKFDYILAMDNSNLAALDALKPESYAGHLGLFMDFAKHRGYREVPDPYYGGDDDFEQVVQLVHDASQGLLTHICQQHLGQ